MDIATGAMGSLLSKLVEVLKDEYELQEGVKKNVEFLKSELTSIHATLSVVAGVPSEQLEDPVRVWADDVRELSYAMEDAVDSFLVRVEGAHAVAKSLDKVKRFKKKIADMCSLLTKAKPRRQIGIKIKDIIEKVNEVAERRNRYMIDNIVAKPTASIDPRVRALYTNVEELVGIDGERDQELIKFLAEDGDVSEDRLKFVSVVGFGGLGKTTFVQAICKKIKSEFKCSAFVSIGRNADVNKVFRDLLLDLDKERYQHMNLKRWDERRLINELRDFLENKRYIIVIDDIWEENVWEYIKCVFPDTNDRGSRVITTTRRVSVAKVCCSSRDDLIFHMKPLNDDDSKKLFHRRVLPTGTTECPTEYEKLSEDILKKCGGVPLAIVTIASLLASDGHRMMKSVHEWDELRTSMSHGLTNGFRMEEMRGILSLSYYDLPSHLKTCLLYLSKFPEDHRIEREDLIWMWITEGFICEERGTSLFEIGETYFTDLIDRSLVQPVFDERSGNVEACRVHDIVLDLISSLSRKENFVTIWDGVQDSKPAEKIARRLSLQSGRKEDPRIAPCMVLSQVRSIIVFPSATCLMPPLSSFDVLRILDLRGCNLGKSGHLSLKDVGNLLQLRYLGLQDTGICDLPAEIEKLQFLQVLDIRNNDEIRKLPSVVCKLRRLMCLKGSYVEIPDGFGGLTSIEVLKSISVDKQSIKELFSLTELRKLRIGAIFDEPDVEEAFMEYLSSLKNIQTVSFGWMEFTERWEPPRRLRMFESEGSYSRVPAWIRNNPTLYCDLSELYLWVRELQQEDMQMIGTLPGLRSFGITVSWEAPPITVTGFPVAMSFGLNSSSPPQIMFQQGALPRAERVKFFSAMPTEEEFDFGLQYLVSLREVDVTLYCPAKFDEADMDKAEAALEQALRAHPNHPSFATSIMLLPHDCIIDDEDEYEYSSQDDECDDGDE